jgi:hypothetical protein
MLLPGRISRQQRIELEPVTIVGRNEHAACRSNTSATQRPMRRAASTRARAWFAPDSAIRIRLGIRQHPLGLLTQEGASDHVRFGRGSDRLGRRAKRFLTPLQKYEIWLQLVRQETTIGEAADQWAVDRSTIMRLREVAKQGALQALAESRPGVRSKEQDLELVQAKAEAARLGEATRGAGRQAAAGRGKRALGLSGRVPARSRRPQGRPAGPALPGRGGGWEFRAACRVLELGTVRAYRWLGRRAADQLEDGRPGGSPLHGLLDWEVAEIVALFHQWGEVDRSHRKLAHRGSYLERVWVSPSSVRRVLAAHGLRLRPLPRPGRSIRKPFPDWVEYRPKSIWIYDTTHFTRAGMAVTATWGPREPQVALRTRLGRGDRHPGPGRVL